MTHRARPIRFADSPLRWMSGLPMWKGGTHYAGLTFDFLGRLDDIKADLTRQIDEGAYRPPLLTEHTPSGLSSGEAVKWRVLTQSEAARLGIEQKADVELYLGFEVRDRALAEAYDEGRLQYTSPEIRGAIVDPQGEPWTDETGHPWSFFLGEVSAVSIPHNKRQTAAPSLRGVQMADKRRVKMSDGTVTEIEVEAPLPEGATEMTEGEPTNAQIMAALNTVMAELQAMKAGGAAAPTLADAGTVAAPPVLSVPAPGPAPMPASMADKRTLATGLVRQAMASKNFGDKTEAALVEIAMRDAAAFVAMADIAPPRLQPGKRQAVSGTQPVKFGSREHAAQMADRATNPDTGDVDPAKYLKVWRDERAQVRVQPAFAAQGVAV